LNVNTDPRNGRPVFNTALFTMPELGQMGTAARRSFCGPGMANSGLALRKTCGSRERVRSNEFRTGGQLERRPRRADGCQAAILEATS
jgi:hypothetical protein